MENLQICIQSLNYAHQPQIEKFFLDCDFKDGWGSQLITDSFFNQRSFAFGAFVNGVLIGCIFFTLSLDFADIDIVLVDNEFKRSGVATKLIRKAITEIADKGIKKVFLEVREGNLPALNLYKKLQFKQIDKRNKYYPDGENALVLVKNLY